MQLSWDEITGQYYGELNDGTVLKQLWLEDETSLKAKMDVINGALIGGIAVWRLGYETADIWDIIK